MDVDGVVESECECGGIADILECGLCAIDRVLLDIRNNTALAVADDDAVGIIVGTALVDNSGIAVDIDAERSCAVHAVAVTVAVVVVVGTAEFEGLVVLGIEVAVLEVVLVALVGLVALDVGDKSVE